MSLNKILFHWLNFEYLSAMLISYYQMWFPSAFFFFKYNVTKIIRICEWKCEWEEGIQKEKDRIDNYVPNALCIVMPCYLHTFR
jgi:hypothetical protein